MREAPQAGQGFKLMAKYNWSLATKAFSLPFDKLRMLGSMVLSLFVLFWPGTICNLQSTIIYGYRWRIGWRCCNIAAPTDIHNAEAQRRGDCCGWRRRDWAAGGGPARGFGAADDSTGAAERGRGDRAAAAARCSGWRAARGRGPGDDQRPGGAWPSGPTARAGDPVRQGV